MAQSRSTLRWGIVATGKISTAFVQDILLLGREDQKAFHIVQAIGSSSKEKGEAFVRDHLNGQQPTIYAGYDGVYNDPEVDIVYVGTPHAFHHQNCLEAIQGGKHILCEKAFTLNAAQAKEVFEAAREKGVFVMEAVWTRFFPLTQALLSLIHEEKTIGDIHRVFCDFAKDQGLATLGPDSRLKNPELGAGSLLNLGIYSLTWALLCLDSQIADEAPKPQVFGAQSLVDGVDVTSSVILQYPNSRHAIVTSSSVATTGSVFCRIEGSQGYIEIEGPTSAPDSFTVYWYESKTSKRYGFKRQGHGFYWEADAVAVDIAAGRLENSTMPWAETIRVLEILDTVRAQSGATFPQEKK
jgi:predicted dehydrogenase